MEVTFYKGVLLSDLSDHYTPGSVTTDIREALMWKERIESKKNKNAAKHVRHGKSGIIKITLDTSGFLSADEFQRAGVSEHSRSECWMNAVRTKAQINHPTSFVLLTDAQLNNMSLI